MDNDIGMLGKDYPFF